MRIIGYIDHPTLKITVFKMDNRLSVKFETGLYEQTYKFRSGEQADSLEDVRQVVDAAMLEDVTAVFSTMHRSRMAALARRHAPEEADEFEEII